MAKSRDLKSGHIRSGDEPTHARSALRMRMWLALFGLVNGISGVIVFELLDSPPFLIVSGALCLVSAVNLAVVMRHIRQGPHYQPGRTIPPYRPVEDTLSSERRKPRNVTPLRTRRIRYLVMMTTCMVLITLAWTWVRYFSVAAAGVMTLVAAVIPPFAAVITNADSPIIHGEPGPADGERDPGESGREQWDDPRDDPRDDRPDDH